MSKKILVLASTFPTSDKDIQPEFVKHLCHELAEAYDVTVLLPGAPGARHEENIGNLKITRFRYFINKYETLSYGSGILSNLKANKYKWGLVPFFMIAQLFSLLKVLKNNNFDAIHVHWIIPQGLIAASAMVLFRNMPPILITSHGADIFALNNAIFIIIKKWILKRSKHITVVSDVMKEFCENSLNVNPSKVSVMSMGVDFESLFTPDVDSQKSNQIVFVGRMVDKKGLSYLIDAMPLVLKVRPDVVLNIVGDGVLQPLFLDQVRRLNIEGSIKFHGAVMNSQIPEVLRKCSISVMPSIITPSGDQEGLGLVILEAIGCGCAVIASDIPAIRTIIKNGENGLLVPQQNHIALAEKIIYLLENEEVRVKLSKNGRNLVSKKYDWKVVGKNYSNLLDTLSTTK